MKRIKLTREEKRIEDAIVRGEYVPVSKEEFEEAARVINAYRKNAVLNIRINQGDLNSLKAKAKELGVKYQTFIAEILHRVAHTN
jgi:predicted DNA binding CopG/RHH family protein